MERRKRVVLQTIQNAFDSIMIIHILMDEKYTSEFIEFINNNFNSDSANHFFLLVTKHNPLRYPLRDKRNVVFIRQNLKSLISLCRYMKQADRIIIHGLFNPYIVYLLFFLRVERKSVWGIWGGDLYDYRKEKGFFKFVKRKVIQKLFAVCTHIKYDADLARKVYGFNGKHYTCLMYKSCLVAEENRTIAVHTSTQKTIMIGNSADNENRHIEILEKLKAFNLENVRIIVPLSYGDQQYADRVEKEYKEYFGNDVICLREFVTREKYYEILSEVDIAIYAHRRQQAVGNITQLLALGAKIFLEPYVTTYLWLKELNINVFSYRDIDSSMFAPLSTEMKQKNNEIICSFASEQNLMNQLTTLFSL